MRRVLIGSVAAVALAGTSIAGAQPAAPPANHRVGPAGSDLRIDPSAAVSPTAASRVAVAYTSGVTDAAGYLHYLSRVTLSDDAGTTWRAAAELPLPPGTNAAVEGTVVDTGGRVGVVSIAYRQDSRGYVVTSPARGGITFVASADRGRHWGRPRILAATTECSFGIEPAMAASRSTVVVVWLERHDIGKCHAPIDARLWVATSHDAGRSWRIQRLPYMSDDYYGLPSVAVTGRRAMLIVRRSCFPSDPSAEPCDRFQTLHAYYSADGGDHFRRPAYVGDPYGIGGTSVAFVPGSRTILALASRFETRTAGVSVLQNEVAVWRSSDDGRTWSAVDSPLPPGISADLPVLAGNPANRSVELAVFADASLADRNNTPLLLSTRDAGRTWSCAQPLAAPPGLVVGGSYTNRLALAAAPSGAVAAVWPDRREYPAAYETLYTASVSPPRHSPADGCGAAAITDEGTSSEPAAPTSLPAVPPVLPQGASASFR